MSATVRITRGVVVITPDQKRLTAHRGMPAVRTRLEEAVEQGKKAVAVDFSGVEYVDGAMMGVLIDAFKGIHRNGGRLCVFGAGDAVHEVLKNTVLDDVIEIVSDQDAAIEALKGKKRNL